MSDCVELVWSSKLINIEYAVRYHGCFFVNGVLMYVLIVT